MSLRFILTRHAKSSWGDPGLDDHDRPLNGRGRASASALGEWLAAREYVPDQVLCSSSARTQETWARIAEGLTTPPKAELLPALYLAEPEVMLGALGWATGKVVMMLAHNPGSAWSAYNLARVPAEDERFGQYPSGATTVFDFKVDSWGEVRWHTGKVVDFVVPRDLL